MAHEAFNILATAIPPLGLRFGGPDAAAEVLSDVYEAAAELPASPDGEGPTALPDRPGAPNTAGAEAGFAAAQKLEALLGKKGGRLADMPQTWEAATPEQRAAVAGYAAVWETVEAVTTRRELPLAAAESFNARRRQSGSAAYLQAVPGRQIPRAAPLAASPFVASLLAQLPEQPRGTLRIMDGIAVWGRHDDATLAQIRRCANDERVAGAAVCADGHKGYAIPIGGVIAYENAVSPNGVGFDIGCGVKAVKTDLRAAELLEPAQDGRTLLAHAMDDIQRTVAFGMGRTSGESADHELFDDDAWADIRELGRMRDMAAKQLGTVGSGNHFVDLARDEAGWVWIVCHFGSRGLGHKTATGFLNLAAGRRWDQKGPGENMDGPAVVLSLDTQLGQRYMRAMELGGRYAYAGRDFVAAQVRHILGAHEVDSVHMHHNYAFAERHGGRDLIVVRKGATPAQPGERGIIAGSMGTPTAIVRGVDSPESAVGFYSAPHGSGRVMSRTAAAGKRDRRTGALLSPGRITPEMLHQAVTARGIELRGGGLDESPQAYRNIDEVLAAHAGVVEVEQRLYPIGVAMAGDSVIDPFKD